MFRRPRSHWLLFLTLICGAVRPAFAASAGVLTGHSVTSWTESEAGPLGAVSAIVQDAAGYLWVGTSSGLFRFDGARFVPWEVLGERPLPASPVSALHIGRDGTLWVGLANRAGVARIKGRRLDLIEAGPLRTIMAIVEDRDGTIWAVSDPELYRLREKTWERVPVRPEDRNERVVNAGVSPDGHLWAGSPSGLFVTRDAGSSFARQADGWVWSVSHDASGGRWVTDILRGFRRPTEVTNPRTDVEGNGYRVLHDSHGALWVATIGEGLWRVRDGDGPLPLIEKATLHSGIFSDSVQSLLEDRDGNLWAGTTVGLYRLTRQKLTPLTNIGLVNAVDATAHELWAGTSYGVVRFTRDADSWRGERAEGPPIYSSAVHRDRRGALWVGALTGLYELIDRRLQPVPLPAGMSAVNCISSDSRGLWLATGRQIVRWDRHRFTPVTLPPDAPGGPICVYVDARERAWIGFAEAKLLVRSPDGAFSRFGAETFGTDANTIYNVSETSDGAVWVSTNVGVTKFTAGETITFTRANGLPSDRVWTVFDDDDKNVWLSLDVGVARLHRHEFVKAASDPAYRLRFESFDSGDGLAGAPILRVRAGRGFGGTLWFVRGGALTVADSRLLRAWPRSAQSNSRVERATIDDGPVETVPDGVVPAGTRRVEIDYTAISLTQPARLRFRYRLEGFDTDWIQAGTRRTAIYTNLPPRAYRFLVQSGTDQDGWHETPAVWQFSVAPAVYQTSWFYTLGAVTIALAVWGVWRFRVGLVRREYAAVLAERARLSREIHDTLLQGVVGVSLQLDAMAHVVGTVSHDARDALVRTRRQLQSYIREARRSILDLRSPLLESKSLSEAIRAIGREAATGTPVEFTLAVAGRPRRCSPRLENEMLRIAQEAITNAMRHAHARTIWLDLNYLPDAVALTVTDDGCGITASTEDASRDAHYGLIVMRERAENLGGRVTVAPLPEGGTRVEAVLPAPAAA
jgi:ligand-binding sensor domain-containing protein/signal transduction histidine kinase